MIGSPQNPFRVKALQRRSATFLLLFLAALTVGLVAWEASAQVFTVGTQQPTEKTRRQHAPRPAHVQRASPRREEAPAPKAKASFSDPAPYCTAVRDADSPGGRYTGAPLPQWIAGASGNGQVGGQRSVSWRCAGGRVLACSETSGQNLCGKVNSGRAPTPEMRSFCTGKRDATIPPAVAGLTGPVWACREGAPSIVGENAGVGQDGYLAANWRDVTDFAPSNSVGVVPRSYVGVWAASVNGLGFIFKVPYAVVVRVTGGTAGKPVGMVEYANYGHVNCVTRLTLRGIEGASLIVDEAITAAVANVNETPDTVCPAQQNATLQLRDGRLEIAWRKNNSPKIKMSGSFQRIR